MKKFIFLLALLLTVLNLSSQLEQQEVTVINIAVSTRVFDGNKFVGNLKIEDFELFEDGIPQKIEALYLTNKTHISKAEEYKKFAPQVSRSFYLLFQLLDYNPKLAEAFDYLFEEVLLPEDNLIIMTPVKTYSMPKQALKKFSKEQLSKEMQSIVRKDITIGSSQYKSIMRDLKRIVRGISGHRFMTDSESIGGEFSSLSLSLPRYRQALLDMEKLRVVDEKWLLMFAQQLKRIEGQKNVFFFYQREFRPEISPANLSRLISMNQDNPGVLGDLQDLFQLYHRYTSHDVDKINQAFADVSLSFNFLFISKESEHISGIYMREQSEDVFKTFSEAANATGGIVNSSQNPSFAFKKALEASESYYLLYYFPKDYKKDGKFKNIEVKVKNKDYKITYRQGYYAK